MYHPNTLSGSFFPTSYVSPRNPQWQFFADIVCITPTRNFLPAIYPLDKVGQLGYNVSMIPVRIRMLKDNLSKYIRLVRDGETILVMDRDTVVAEIRRPENTDAAKSNRLKQYIEELSEKGEAEPAAQRPSKITAVLQESKKHAPPVSWADVLRDSRDDRV